MKVRFSERLLGFHLSARTVTRLEGRLELSDVDLAYIHAWEENHEDWYLSEDGDRLADDQLLEASPWSIVADGAEQKVVQRYLNMVTGECWFSLAAPVQLSDYVRS